MADLAAAIKAGEAANQRLCDTLAKTCGKDLGIVRTGLLNDLEQHAAVSCDTTRSLLAAAREAEANLATATRELDEAQLSRDQAFRVRNDLRSQCITIEAEKEKAEAALAEMTERWEQYSLRLAGVLTVLDGAGPEVAPPPGSPPEKLAPYVSHCPTYAAAHRVMAALAEERRRREEAAITADLAGLPVHFVAHLPRGRIFMHPDTPTSGVRDPWPPPIPPQEPSR